MTDLVKLAAEYHDETVLFAVAGVMLGFYVTVKAVSLVIDFVRRG